MQCTPIMEAPLCNAVDPVLGTQQTPQLGATIYLHHLTQTNYCLKRTLQCSAPWCTFTRLFNTVLFCPYKVVSLKRLWIWTLGTVDAQHNFSKVGSKSK